MANLKELAALTRTLPYSVYKKTAEIQFHLSPPRRAEDGRRWKEGGIFINIAEQLPRDRGGDGTKLDWDNKMVMFLNARELKTIEVKFFRNMFPIRLTHGPATLVIEPGSPIERGDLQGLMTWRWSLGQQGKHIGIFVDDVDMHGLFDLFRYARTHALGWDLVEIGRKIVADRQGESPPAEDDSAYAGIQDSGAPPEGCGHPAAFQNQDYPPEPYCPPSQGYPRGPAAPPQRMDGPAQHQGPPPPPPPHAYNGGNGDPGGYRQEPFVDPRDQDIPF